VGGWWCEGVVGDSVVSFNWSHSPCLSPLLSFHVLQHNLDLSAAVTRLTLLVHAVTQCLGEGGGEEGRGQGGGGERQQGRVW